MHTPYPTGAPWLARALVMSAVLHALVAGVVVVAGGPAAERHVDVVDIELAPPPPKAEALLAERAAPVNQAPQPPAPEPAATTEPEEHREAAIDAGVDAPAKQPADAGVGDAGVDAGLDAVDAAADAPVDAGMGDAGETVPSVAQGANGQGAGSATGSGSGVPAATAAGSGSGIPGMTDEPAVDGAPTSAGTAANLLAYFPAGHIVALLIRFDRLRGTEWAGETEGLLKPLPDYRGLFGGKDASIADRLETLIISSPRPRDATATTLVARTSMSRKQMRDFLGNGTAITWSTARGGMLGKRPSPAMNDRRMVLSPWKGWFVLAAPEDLGGLAAASGGNLETAEARGSLPPWLATIRTIEKESGDDAKRGPAIVVTLAGNGKRTVVPDVGLGVRSLPTPERASIAVELVTQGWLVRGNIRFASEADAAEFVRVAQQAQQRIADSLVLSAVLRSQHVLNAIAGLSLTRTGDRVSYATSVSIADARAVLAAAAATLELSFGHP
jgi:hypothetical protein